jgi:hypothetical protein
VTDVAALDVMTAKTGDGGDTLWFQWRDEITIREAAIWVDLFVMLSARASDLVETAQQLRATCDSQPPPLCAHVSHLLRVLRKR